MKLPPSSNGKDAALSRPQSEFDSPWRRMHPKYQEAIKLRLQGNSYGVIAKSLRVSKSSVSNWCKNLKLSSSARKIIENKNKHIKEKFKLYNQRKHQFVQIENKKIIEKAVKQIPLISKRDLLLIGTALYWAEGYRRQDRNRSPRVNIANSDPALISIFLRFLRKILKVPEERFKVSIRIHPNINAKSTINFWSKITKIPQNRFHITTQISKASQRKRPHNSLPYGTLDLRVNSRQKFCQIKGWIDGLIKQST